MIDLRSDTVTRPTEGMLIAMTEAETGDDVFREDPTVNAFQKKIAGMFGMEAGLFVPSGVMSNQLAIKILTQPSDEVITERTNHIFNYETAAAAHHSAVQINPVSGKRGKLNAALVREAMRRGEEWEPRPSLIVIENATNKGGGACYTREELKELRLAAKELGLRLHLDGARLWNAITATNLKPVFFGSIAETITVSFSKGLGAPVGSMLLGSQDHILTARRYRKMFGGGMRQIGVLAAAADYGVEHHWPLLEEDHRRARDLASTIDSCSGLFIDPETVETNIVIFDVKEGDADHALSVLKDEEILMVPFGPRTIRATFHHQIDDAALKKTKDALIRHFG